MPKSHTRQAAFINLGTKPSSLLLVTPLSLCCVKTSYLKSNMERYGGSITNLLVNVHKTCNMWTFRAHKKHISTYLWNVWSTNATIFKREQLFCSLRCSIFMLNFGQSFIYKWTCFKQPVLLSVMSKQVDTNMVTPGTEAPPTSSNLFEGQPIKGRKALKLLVLPSLR